MDRESSSGIKPMLSVGLPEGYPFRNAASIVKSETEHAAMSFFPDRIEISFSNKSKCTVHKLVILAEHIVYLYDPRDSQGELLPEYTITFETSELFNTTKGIGRRDGIVLYVLPDESVIRVQPKKSGNKDSGKSSDLFVNIINQDSSKYGTPELTGPPNNRIQAKDFSDVCNQGTTMKCSHLNIRCFDVGLEFLGVLPNQTKAFSSRFLSQATLANGGQPTGAYEGEPLFSIRVPIATVKALSKIHNVSSPGVLLKFYYSMYPSKDGSVSKDGLICIESPIGNYGTYSIGLKDCN